MYLLQWSKNFIRHKDLIPGISTFPQRLGYFTFLLPCFVAVSVTYRLYYAAQTVQTKYLPKTKDDTKAIMIESKLYFLVTMPKVGKHFF